MSKTYRHLFFDLDHTLWDFDRNSEATLFSLYEEYKLVDMGVADFKDFFKIYNAHNDRLWERFRNGYIRRDDLRWKRIWYTLLDYKIGNTALAYELSAAYLEMLPVQKLLIPFAKEVLQYCADKQYVMHLITNGFETTQWQKLQYSGIAGFFDAVITSEKSNSMKPHAGIFDFALKLTGASVAESIMIGDALEIDIMGALNAGWDQVYFNPQRIAHSRKPTYEIHQLDMLKEIL